MSIKRTIITTIVALALVATVAPVSANATTIDELLAQIAQLQAQLTTLQGGSTTVTTGTGACAGVTFTRNLTVGSTGSDVKCLQTILNRSATTQIAVTGAGAPGSETTYFGSKTLVAVKKYQAAKGFTPANQVGPMTRAALNAELGSTTTTPVTPVTPSTGGLSVSLASDTPAASTVATGANANFAKVLLTAGTGDVNISRLVVTRSGMSANADLQNLEFVDAATGAYLGGIGTLNSDGNVTFTFVPQLSVKAGTTRAFYLKSGVKTVANGATSGHTIVLGINSAASITSNATAVSGSFPVNGNPMSVVALTVGTVSIATDGAVTDATPNVGATDVVVDQFKLTAGTTEAVTIENITAKRTGSASVSDVSNIKLWNVSTGQLLSTVTTWDTYDKAVFSNLNLSIDKGKTVRFKITVDIVGGAGNSKTVNADVIDGTDVLVVAKGQLYGYYITPDITAAFDGAGAANQTIANGSLTVSKSTTTPPTGNIATGSDVVLGIFDFDAKGEDIKISQTKVTVTAALLADSDITKVAIYDSTGTMVAGPNSLSGLVATFSDTYIVPVGVHPYTVKATLADSISNNTSVLVSITNPRSNITATGMLSNNSITTTSLNPNANVDANTLTVQGAGLTITTLGSPAGRSIPKGTSDFVFATFSLDAGSAGENIQVTSIITTDSLGGSAAATDVANAELWADLTSANSSRGDIYETKISNTYQPTATTQTFSISPTLTITKGTFVKLALVADLKAGAGDGNHTFSVNSGASAQGASTGNALIDGTNLSYVTSAKQTMATTTGGVLTVTRDSSSPVADIILGEASGATLGVFKLAASNVEDLDLDQITYTTTGGTYASTLYFYDGTRLLGSVPGATSGTVVFPDGTLTIPANSNKLVTVKADVYPVDNATLTNGQAFRVGMQGATNIKTTGKLSGQTVSSSSSVLGNIMKIYKSKPTFAKNSASPSGQLVPLSNQLVAVFDITAATTDDISFTNGYDSLKLNVSASVNDTTQNQLSFTLKDSDGNTLDSNTQAAATTSSKAVATTVTFRFASTGLTISKGTTKQVYVYADLSDFEDTGDSMQVYWDATDANCTFGIGGNTSTSGYAEGSKIFRNNIYANTLTRTN